MTVFPHQLLYTEKILPKKRQVESYTFLHHKISDLQLHILI